MTVITKYLGDIVTVHLYTSQLNVDASDNIRPQKKRGKTKRNINIHMERSFKASQKAEIAKYVEKLIAHERGLRGNDQSSKINRNYNAKNMSVVSR